MLLYRPADQIWILIKTRTPHVNWWWTEPEHVNPTLTPGPIITRPRGQCNWGFPSKKAAWATLYGWHGWLMMEFLVVIKLDVGSYQSGGSRWGDAHVPRGLDWSQIRSGHQSATQTPAPRLSRPTPSHHTKPPPDLLLTLPIIQPCALSWLALAWCPIVVVKSRQRCRPSWGLAVCHSPSLVPSSLPDKCHHGHKAKPKMTHTLTYHTKHITQTLHNSTTNSLFV